VPGTTAKERTLIEDDHLHVALFHHYNAKIAKKAGLRSRGSGPEDKYNSEDSESECLLQVHYPDALPEAIRAGSLPLESHADFLNFALLDGRRIVPATRARNYAENLSLVQLKYDGEILV
jgi:hypothetical protein